MVLPRFEKAFWNDHGRLHVVIDLGYLKASLLFLRLGCAADPHGGVRVSLHIVVVFEHLFSGRR